MSRYDFKQKLATATIFQQFASFGVAGPQIFADLRDHLFPMSNRFRNDCE